MNAKRKVAVVAVAGVALTMFTPAQPAHADNWCTSIKTNGRSLFGEAFCAKLQEIIKDPIPGDPGSINPSG